MIDDVTYEVTAVLPGDPPRVNVKAGANGQAISGITVPGGYLNPAVGDIVAIGGPVGAFYVACCYTPGRRYVDPFTVTVQAANPSGMDQIASIWAQAGKSTQPALVLVRTTTPVTPPPGAPGATIAIPAASSNTYRPSLSEWMNQPGVYQGVYGGYGQHYGLWFYGAAAFTGPLASVTPKSGSVYIRRKAGSGAYADEPVYLYLHNHATQPAGSPALGEGPLTAVSLPPEGEAEVPLPLSWLNQLKAGTAKGFAVTTDLSSDYAQYHGRAELAISGRVTITY